MERATNSSLILYTTEDGLTKIEATFDRDTVWLSIYRMADLFQRNKSTVLHHIGNIYKEGELDRPATVAKFATVQMEGERQVERQIEYYKDWLETIDDYLKMTRREILTTSGHVSNQQALQKAHAEYDKYKK